MPPYFTGVPPSDFLESSVGDLQIRKSLLPNADLTVDVGAPAKRFKVGYFETIDSSDGYLDTTKLPLAGGVMSGPITNLTSADEQVRLGKDAGAVNQGINTTAVGWAAGGTNQLEGATAVGSGAGEINQSADAVAVGFTAGYDTQGASAVAIGQNAGRLNQGQNAIAVGLQAGRLNQGDFSVAIGANAMITDQPSESMLIVAKNGGDQSVSGPNTIRLIAGSTVLEATPTLLTHQGNTISTQSFVTDGDALKVSKTGDTMTGTLTAPNITTLAGGLTNVGFAAKWDTGVEIRRIDTNRIALQNTDGDAAQCSFLIRGKNLGDPPPTPYNVAELNLGAAFPGGSGILRYTWNGSDMTVPNAGGNLNNLGLCHVGFPCDINMYNDGSLYVNGGTLRYDQGSKAGVGNDGLKITDSTVSTSPSTGALQVTGGVGILGNVNMAGLLNGLTPAGGKFSQTTNVVIANTAFETQMLGTGIGSLTVAPNMFQAGGSYKASGGGVMSCLNNAELTIRIYGGSGLFFVGPPPIYTGTLLGTLPTLQIPTSTGKWWGIDIYITVRQLGLPGAAIISARAAYKQNVDSQNGVIGQSFHTLNTTTFDTTIANTLQLTAQWGAADAGNSITTTQMVLYQTY